MAKIHIKYTLKSILKQLILFFQFFLIDTFINIQFLNIKKNLLIMIIFKIGINLGEKRNKIWKNYFYYPNLF